MKEDQEQRSGAHAGPSRQVRHSKSGGQSSGSFSHAHHFQIKDSHLYDVNQNVHYYDYRKGKTSGNPSFSDLITDSNDESQISNIFNISFRMVPFMIPSPGSLLPSAIP